MLSFLHSCLFDLEWHSRSPKVIINVIFLCLPAAGLSIESPFTSTFVSRRSYCSVHAVYFCRPRISRVKYLQLQRAPHDAGDLAGRQRRTCSWHRVTWWLDAADSALWWIPSTDVIVMLAIQPTMPSVWSDHRRDHGRPPSDTQSASYSHHLLLMIIIRYTSK